tara:strand:- start:318 stop:542 length:225 start_codon:yes stop_codon:yes gene_type:complete
MKLTIKGEKRTDGKYIVDVEYDGYINSAGIRKVDKPVTMILLPKSIFILMDRPYFKNAVNMAQFYKLEGKVKHD